MLKHKYLFVLLLVFALLLTACSSDAEPTEAVQEVVEVSEPTEAPIEEPEVVEPEVEEPTEEVVEEPTEEPEPEGFAWIPPMEAEEALSRTAVSEAEQATFDTLDAQNFAKKDTTALAAAFLGITEIEPPPEDPREYKVGDKESFWVQNDDTREWNQIELTLEAVTEHAYLWFDMSRITKDAETVIANAAEGFEKAYVQDVAVFGDPPIPGIDGDPRLFILHISALDICSVDESTSHQCGIAGYWASHNSLPVEIEEHSNEHELFVINTDIGGIGGHSYQTVLIHELRHLIESAYGRNDDGWVVEGTAMFSETLINEFRDQGGRASEFTSNTDMQINTWTSGNTFPYYGVGYLFVSYIYERIGDEAFTDWQTSPGRSFYGLDAALEKFEYDFNGMDLWKDWMVSVALLGVEEIPEWFSYREEEMFVEPAAKTMVNKFPKEYEDTVKQFAFDIYDIRSSEPVTIDFTGTTKTQVVNSLLPASGEYYWYSGRANESTMSFTREFDLSAVETATLNFSSFYKIESGWDFGYVLVSTDGGETWEGLAGDNMESKEAGDDPAESSYTDFFFTGNTKEWVEQTADLSAYAGQVVQIRFMFITDLVYTMSGMAIDNIAIPEIDFYDDCESGANGWEAEGFNLVTAYEAQRFEVLLVTFDETGVVVTPMELAADNTGSLVVPMSEDFRKAFLITAASNDLILTPAEYTISFNK